MNRRGLLKWLGVGGAAAVAAPVLAETPGMRSVTEIPFGAQEPALIWRGGEDIMFAPSQSMTFASPITAMIIHQGHLVVAHGNELHVIDKLS